MSHTRTTSPSLRWRRTVSGVRLSFYVSACVVHGVSRSFVLVAASGTAECCLYVVEAWECDAVVLELTDVNLLMCEQLLIAVDRVGGVHVGVVDSAFDGICGLGRAIRKVGPSSAPQFVALSRTSRKVQDLTLGYCDHSTCGVPRPEATACF